jgi:hypothetical protein
MREAAALDQHGLPSLQPRPVHDPRVGGDEGERQGGGFAHRQIRRLQREQVGVDGCVLGERPLNAANSAGHAVHLVTGLERTHARADRFNDARHVDTQHQRQRMLRVVGAAGANLGIERIQTAGRDPHEHLALRRARTGQFRQFEGAVVTVEYEGVHGHGDLLPVESAL